MVVAETGLVRAQQSDISQIGTWARTAGGSGIDRARSQAIDKDQNIYVAGQFENNVTFRGGTTSITLNSKGGSDIFIAKYDKCGNLLWAKAIGDDGEDVAKSIVVDDLGNFFIAGYFENIVDFNPGAGTNTLSSTLFTRDAFFGKYDKNGNYLWAKKIGGPDFDIGNAIRLDKTDGTGNIYVAGYFYGITNFNPAGSDLLTSSGQADAFFAKYNSAGNFIWAKSIGGDIIDIANDLQVNSAGEVFITGYYTALADFNPSATTNNLISAGNEDIFLAKYNSSGNYVWARSMGGTTRTDQGLSIKLQSDGKILLAGQFGGTADFDPTSTTSALTTAGSFDAFFGRYTSTGNLEFAKSLGGGGDDAANSITLDSIGRIYVGGFFSGSMDADPGAGVSTLTGKGGRDIFIGKYSNLGDLIWAKGTGGITGNEVAQEISVDTSGNVYAAGTYVNDADFDPSDSTINFIGFGGDDAYLLKIDSNGLVSRVIFDINNNIQCFPDHEVILRNQSTGVNSNYVFTWDMGNGVTLTGNEIKYKYPVPGIYDIKLKVTDGATCNSQSILKTTIGALQKTDFQINSNTYCLSGNTHQITNKSTIAFGTLTYEWSMGDGQTFTTKDVTHSYSNPGKYVIRLITRSNTGCTDSLSKEIEIFPSPITKFSLNDSTQCFDGNNFTTKNLTQTNGLTSTYTWYWGDGTQNTGFEPAHQYTQDGNFSIKLVTRTSGCSDSSTIAVSVIKKTVFDIKVNNPIQCFKNHLFTLINKTIIDPTQTFTWSFGDGQTSIKTVSQWQSIQLLIHSAKRSCKYGIHLDIWGW